MRIKLKFVNKSKLVACMLAFGISTTYVSCVTDDDEDGVELEGQEPVEEDTDAVPTDVPMAQKTETEKPADPQPLKEIPAAPIAPQASGIPPTGQAPAASANTSPHQRRVMYVKENGTAVRATADHSAKVVSKLKKGDHILVNIEGDWARTDQGTFISMENLSEKGIGRGGKSTPTWSESQANPVLKAKKKNKNK